MCKIRKVKNWKWLCSFHYREAKLNTTSTIIQVLQNDLESTSAPQTWPQNYHTTAAPNGDQPSSGEPQSRSTVSSSDVKPQTADNRWHSVVFWCLFGRNSASTHRLASKVHCSLQHCMHTILCNSVLPIYAVLMLVMMLVMMWNNVCMNFSFFTLTHIGYPWCAVISVMTTLLLSYCG